MPNNNILSMKTIARLFIVAIMTTSFVACNRCSTVGRDIHGQAIARDENGESLDTLDTEDPAENKQEATSAQSEAEIILEAYAKHQKWEYHKEQDEMTGKAKYSANISSTSIFEIQGDTIGLALSLTYNPDGTADKYVIGFYSMNIMNMQQNGPRFEPSCELILAKFDDDEAKSLFAGPSQSSICILQGDEWFLKKIPNSQQLTVRVKFESGEVCDFKFNISNFSLAKWKGQ